jgi:hypothetical protein
MKTAPLVLFVYNRPDHTRQTLNALKNNLLADQTRLYIYADGPKENLTLKQQDAINEVQRVIKEEQWCKEVIIKESKTNKGLAKSIIEGVTEIINQYGKVIVLEDDLVTSPFFLQFMNEGLDLYQNTSNVYSINGFMFPVNYHKLSSVLLPFSSTWGWATWKEKWEAFDNEMKQKQHIIQNIHLSNRFNVADYSFVKMLDQVANSWGIRWYYSIFIKNGLGVFPTKSLVKNIGFDGSGTNKELNKSEELTQNEQVTIIKEININLEFYKLFMDYLTQPKANKTLLSKLKLSLSNLWDKESFKRKLVK